MTLPSNVSYFSASYANASTTVSSNSSSSSSSSSGSSSGSFAVPQPKTLVARTEWGLFNNESKKSDKTQKLMKQEMIELQNHLAPFGITAGTAVSEGDCFFHSLAKQLDSMGITIPVDQKYAREPSYKKLRLFCYEKLQAPDYAWLKPVIEKDANWGGDNFATYLSILQYTHTEITQKPAEEKSSLIAIWGKPDIEGRLICQAFNIKLHLIEFQEHEHKAMIVHQFIDAIDSLTMSDPEFIKATYADPQYMHIASAHGHFVPLMKTTAQPTSTNTTASGTLSSTTSSASMPAITVSKSSARRPKRGNTVLADSPILSGNNNTAKKNKAEVVVAQRIITPSTTTPRL